MKESGYSGTPLAKKLGIKDGFVIALYHAPDYYFSLFLDFPEKVEIVDNTQTQKDLIHYFVVKAQSLNNDILTLKSQLKSNGILWISWYKKSAKIETDITEDVIRTIALKNGLVDVKVCAVDEYWSGLKLVIPVKDR